MPQRLLPLLACRVHLPAQRRMGPLLPWVVRTTTQRSPAGECATTAHDTSPMHCHAPSPTWRAARAPVDVSGTRLIQRPPARLSRTTFSVLYRPLSATKIRRLLRRVSKRPLLLPACQNGFALKQLGSTPDREDRQRDQDNGGNDGHKCCELKLARELAQY